MKQLAMLFPNQYRLDKGSSSYRGLVQMPGHLKGCKNNTECDALLINNNSQTDTYPSNHCTRRC